METKNFFRNFAFIFGSKGSLSNFIPSILFGLKQPGVVKFISRVNDITAEEFLEVILMKDLDNVTFEKAKGKFMLSPSGIANVNSKDKLAILSKISGQEAVSLFDAKFFSEKEEGCVESLESVFALANANQQKWLAEVIMMFFSKESNKMHWTDDRAYMFETVTTILVNNLNLYSNEELVSKEFVEYLIDNYGLGQSFCKNNDVDFIRVMDHATQAGIIRFFTEGEFGAKTNARLYAIEQSLFESDKETLIAMVSAFGSLNPFVEGYLIQTGELPDAAVEKTFCHAENFQALVELKGILEVVKLFPKNLMQTMPNLWSWLGSYETPLISSKGCSAEEWKYVLANDKFRNFFLKIGGKLSGKDITYLAKIGKYAAIASYRGKN